MIGQKRAKHLGAAQIGMTIAFPGIVGTPTGVLSDAYRGGDSVHVFFGGKYKIVDKDETVIWGV